VSERPKIFHHSPFLDPAFGDRYTAANYEMFFANTTINESFWNINIKPNIVLMGTNTDE